MTRRKRLGRGLEALLNTTSDAEVKPPVTIASHTIDDDQLPPEAQDGSSTSDVVHLSVYEIEDNPFQPRRVFSESEIASLSESLKEHDILQPILVRIIDGRYQLISGERRLRAAIQANWQTIPARVREADDRLVSELAIVENLQRKDLNPIEKAMSFRRYIDEHHCTQEDLANRLKIDRSTIANLMRLLELPDRVREALSTGAISAGHARALLPLGDEDLQVAFCDQICQDGMSVRAIERAVSEHVHSEDHPESATKQNRKRTQDQQIESLQQELKNALGTKVVIKQGSRQKGQIVVHFSNANEFERLRDQLVGRDSSSAEFRVA